MNKMRKTLLLLVALAVVTSGCATKQGIALPRGPGPSKEDIADFNKRNTAPSGTSSASQPGQVTSESLKTALVPPVDGPRMVLIGNVMALTVLDESALNTRYDNYLKQLQAHSANPAFTREWYLATSGGETAVKFSGVTGIYTRYFKVEVPKDLLREISFASAFGTFMAGTSGDLVAAERSAQYGFWLTRLLCSEKSADYDACASRYHRGLYQSIDGKEIDDKLQLVQGGRVIDPVTYKLPAEEAPQVAAQPHPAPSPVPVAPAGTEAATATTPSTPAPTSTTPQQKDAAVQLEKLNELRTKGLITDDEYQKKRKEILDSL